MRVVEALKKVAAAAGRAELAVVTSFGRHPHLRPTSAARALASIGSGGFVWLGLGALAAVRRGDRRLVVDVGGSIYAAGVASIALSRLLGRRRPCQRTVVALIDCPDSPSFPSDQAAAAAAGAAAIAGHVPEATPAVAALAVSVMVARVYAGVHYPSDVLAGAALGLLTARLVRRISPM